MYFFSIIIYTLPAKYFFVPYGGNSSVIIDHIYLYIYIHVDTCAALVGSQMVLGGGKITRDNPPRGDYVIAERYDVTTQTEPSEKAQDLTKYYSYCVCRMSWVSMHSLVAFSVLYIQLSVYLTKVCVFRIPLSSLTLAPPPSSSPL